jgi:hypothetical protein
MGWSGAGRAGGIVVQLRTRHNGVRHSKHAGFRVTKALKPCRRRAPREVSGATRIAMPPRMRGGSQARSIGNVVRAST